jgi:hypothetical protein
MWHRQIEGYDVEPLDVRLGVYGMSHEFHDIKRFGALRYVGAGCVGWVWCMDSLWGHPLQGGICLNSQCQSSGQ